MKLVNEENSQILKFLIACLKVMLNDVFAPDIFLILFSCFVNFRDEKKAIARRQRNKKIKRYLMVGIATLGGGAVLGNRYNL